VLKKLLIANRGEIAVRVVRTCQFMGIATVAVYAADDRNAWHVEVADEAVELRSKGGILPYLDIDATIAAALETGADAVHPGYGFLSESAGFAQAVIGAGLQWVGPDPATIALLGDKREARRSALSVGVAVVPGLHDGVTDAGAVIAFGREQGWPVVVKAAHGGGGRGLRVIDSQDDAVALVESAQRESRAAFGSEEFLVERFVKGGRHIEVQILGDRRGVVVAVGDRECSVQRRHQKLIEEAPATAVDQRVRERLAVDAVRLMSEIGYVGAGTVEFLVVGEEAYFLEVNTRLQVEHPVTEAVYGVDLVAEQIRIAAGDGISFAETPVPRGHAIEARVTAEDPYNGFMPEAGRLGEFAVPDMPGLRVDAGYRSGDVVPARYDSLLAKVIAHRPEREQARRALVQALRATRMDGLPSAIPATLQVLVHEDFVRQDVSTEWFEGQIEPGLRSKVNAGGLPYDDEEVVVVNRTAIRLPRVPGPSGHRRPRRRENAVLLTSDEVTSGDVRAPMNGTVIAVHVRRGDVVAGGGAVVTIEAMKMENVVRAPASGVVEALEVSVGDEVRRGGLLVRVV
jgi:acetyl-CoA/propionyl-CoA carboxylase, biotin carboxylase, biotin carboxyl carrier protein